MSEKLSQAEIDALINSFQTGGEDAVETLQAKGNKKDDFRRYDFNRPEKFSIDNLQSIERIASNFAKNLSQTLSGKLRFPFNVEFSGIEQIPFVSDYADIMTKDYYGFFVTDLGHPELNEIVLEIDLAFVMAVHKRWLGNELPKELPKRRSLTDSQQITATKLLETTIYENLDIAFNSVAEINSSFVAFQTDSQLLKITSGTDMIALVTLNISCEFWESTIRLVIPFESVEGIIDKLTVENIMEFSPNKKKKNYRQEIKKGLENVVEEVSVTVGQTKMALNEIAKLEAGDIIQFDSKINEPIKGYAAGVHKFNCLLGKSMNKKAFRFLDFTEETKEMLKEE